MGSKLLHNTVFIYWPVGTLSPIVYHQQLFICWKVTPSKTERWNLEWCRNKIWPRKHVLLYALFVLGGKWETAFGLNSITKKQGGEQSSVGFSHVPICWWVVFVLSFLRWPTLADSTAMGRNLQPKPGPLRHVHSSNLRAKHKFLFFILRAKHNLKWCFYDITVPKEKRNLVPSPLLYDGNINSWQRAARSLEYSSRA